MEQGRLGVLDFVFGEDFKSDQIVQLASTTLKATTHSLGHCVDRGREEEGEGETGKRWRGKKGRRGEERERWERRGERNTCVVLSLLASPFACSTFLFWKMRHDTKRNVCLTNSTVFDWFDCPRFRPLASLAFFPLSAFRFLSL